MAATPSKDDIKKALKDNMKELKSLGSRTQDSARQITDATAALCQFPYLRPTIGVLPGGHHTTPRRRHARPSPGRMALSRSASVAQVPNHTC